MNRGPASQSRWFTVAALAAVAAGWLTLRSAPGQAPSADLTPWDCLVCGPAGGADVFQNLLLFLPVGLALARAGTRAGLAIGLALVFSTGIELTQAVALIGRDAALGDILANTAGAALGWRLGHRWQAWLLPTGRTRDRSAGVVLAVFLVQLLISGWLAAPLVDLEPGSATRIAPTVPGRPTYGGAVTALQLGGEAIGLSGGRPDRFGQPTGQPPATIAAGFSWEPEASGALTPILRIDDRRGWAIAAIDRRMGEVGVELRTRSHLLRLRPQSWVLGLPVGVAEGDPLDVRLAIVAGRVTGSVTSPGGTASDWVPYGAQHGWALINPFTPAHSVGGPDWQRWTLAWLLGWGVLLGWWGGAARRPLAWCAAALLGSGFITALWHARASNLELLALAVGWGLAAVSSRRCHRSAGGP